jgi:hypothetical protein
MKESTDNGVDFEMQELLRKQYESEVFEFSIYTKSYNPETKIHAAVFNDFFTGTFKDLDKRNYDKNIYLIEKRKPIKRPELDWCVKYKQSLSEKNGTAEKRRLRDNYNYLNGNI